MEPSNFPKKSENFMKESYSFPENNDNFPEANKFTLKDKQKNNREKISLCSTDDLMRQLEKSLSSKEFINKANKDKHNSSPFYEYKKNYKCKIFAYKFNYLQKNKKIFIDF